jgi:hypothetical protein
MTILRRCRESEEDIRRLEMRIRQRRLAIDSLQATQMDPNGGIRGSGDPYKMGRMFSEVDLLERELDRRQEHPLQPLKHGLQPRLFPFRPLTQQHLETAPACLPSLSGLFFPLMYEASGSLPSPWC